MAGERAADAAVPHLGQGRPQRGRRLPGPRRELRRQGQQLQVLNIKVTWMIPANEPKVY